MPEPIALPDAVRRIAAAVRDAGGHAYLVGGCVRDHLLGRGIVDWDIEVFGVPSDALQAALTRCGRVSLVGRSFGVFKVRPRGWTGPEIDVSIPRRDAKVGPGHRGIAVEGDPSMSVHEAARRRDLTVNAILYDLDAEGIVDPWDGAGDLAAQRLRAVDRDTFLEDPLRALRVVQFAARLGFAVDPGLVDLCREAALDELPVERIQGEWVKLLLAGVAPSIGLGVARRAAILERVFPEVADADPVATDAALDRLAAGPRDALEPEGRRLALMVAGWLHLAPLPAAERSLDRLGLHRWAGFDARATALALLAHRTDPIDGDAALRWLSTRCEVELALWLRWSADAGFDPTPYRARAAALGVLNQPPPPLLLGRHLAPLGLPPGPAMGQLLRRVYDAQLDGDVSTPDEALALARTLVSAGPEDTRS